MRGTPGRLAKVFLLAAAVLAIAASSSSAALPAHAPMLGVVPHAGVVQPFGALSTFAPAPPPSGPLVLQTQPCNLTNFCWVMRTNAIYAIYWMPSDNACDAILCSAYQAGVNRYFTDVAHDSGRSTNVYSAATQYYDATGPISYASTFAGSTIDTDPFPASGCDDTYKGVGDPICLTDQQLQTEIQKVLTAKGWHGSTTTMFFLLTPSGVGSCFLPGTATGDPNQGCTTTAYCAYHSGFVDSNDEPVIYGNEPFNATIAGCHDISSGNGTQGSPNDPDIDPTLNTISHEHNEAITDPWGDAWYSNDAAGDENGDLCAWDFGATQLTAGGQPYNQVINGHDYSLQQEYSNDGLGCVQHYLGVPVDFGAPTVSGLAAQGHVLTAAHGLWSQSPTSYAYAWQRCAANGTGCANIPDAAASTYSLTAADAGRTVRVEVSAHNTAGTSALVPSAVTAVVVPLPNATVAPAVSGSAAVHQQLSTTNGTWSTAANFAYAWLRCAAAATGCAVIPDATAPTYVATSADVGHVLEARVSATNAAGTATAVSNASPVVVDKPGASAAPHISGKAKVGKKLTASHGAWSGTPSAYRYQWLRCNARGSSCKNIGKATQAKYKVTKRDAKHRLRVKVTAVNAAGSAAATSGATAVVKH
jgi:hypothetical protein